MDSHWSRERVFSFFSHNNVNNNSFPCNTGICVRHRDRDRDRDNSFPCNTGTGGRQRDREREIETTHSHATQVKEGDREIQRER